MEAFGYENKYLAEYASDGGTPHLTFDAAVKACLADGSANGITKEAEGRYTVRAGSDLKDSPSGEVSWLKRELEEAEEESQQVTAAEDVKVEEGFLSNAGNAIYAQAQGTFNYYTSAPGQAVVTPVLRDDNVKHAENVELRARIKQGKLQKRLDRSLTGGDQAVGEEELQREVDVDDLVRWQREFEEKYGTPDFDWEAVAASAFRPLRPDLIAPTAGRSHVGALSRVRRFSVLHLVLP